MTWNPYRLIIRELEAIVAHQNHVIDQRAELWAQANTSLARMTESYGRERGARLVAEEKLARMSSGLQRHNAQRKLDAATRRMAEQTARARKTLELRGAA